MCVSFSNICSRTPGVALQLRPDTRLVLKAQPLPIKHLWLKKISLWPDRYPRNKNHETLVAVGQSFSGCNLLLYTSKAEVSHVESDEWACLPFRVAASGPLPFTVSLLLSQLMLDIG